MEESGSEEFVGGNEIRIEIEGEGSGHHGHAIQAHYMEGLVVPSSHHHHGHMTLAPGNTIIVEDPDGVQHDGYVQMVSLATDENGETILLVPKGEENSVVVLNSTGEEMEEGQKERTLYVVSSSGQDQQQQEQQGLEVEGGRPKRKAALKALEARSNKGAKKGKVIKDTLEIIEGAPEPSTAGSHSQSSPVKKREGAMENGGVENIGEDEEDEEEEDPGKEAENALISALQEVAEPGGAEPGPASEGKKVGKGKTKEVKVPEDESSSEDEDIPTRRCVVCLQRKRFTENIFDTSKQLYYHIDVLISHLNIQVKGTPSNTGLCPECMNHLQRWHIFNCAIAKRHEEARNAGLKVFEDKLNLHSFETKVYKNYKKMARVKEVFSSATHSYYTRRHLTEKDWDFFCDHLFHSNSVKSEKSKTLEKFITSREKLSKFYCTVCERLIPNGKRGFAKHMHEEHQQMPVLYPCDICGSTYPDKDMTASTEDYYPHWISHFYFNKCDDCGKRFPTKRALGQHRHAVHKNRQVKCEKCGKVLANKMSLDLHLLRHLPENEKKKYMIKCKVCKRKIAQWNMKSHLATHNENRPWKCDHCEATFKMKGALVSHRDVVHFNLKNHVCVICGDAFKSASSLRGHVRRHEGRKDYKCEVCLKEYYTYSALKGHKVVHQTVRNHICATCGKAFKKKKALDEHVTIHTGVKPHKCPICGREIRVKSNLYKHMKIHKKAQENQGSAPTTQVAINRKPTSTATTHDEASNQQAELNSTIISSGTGWPANGTMMVTLDNGTVVSDVTPLVVSFVTTGADGMHSTLELNSEQHAQLINAVAVHSADGSSGETTFLTTTTPHHPFTTTSTQHANLVHATVECTEEEFSQQYGSKKRDKILLL